MSALPPAIASARRTEPAIRARGLTRRFGHVTAVDHIDLDIPRAPHLRLPRPERLGQVDDDPHAVRPAAAERRHGRGARPRMPRDAEQLRTRLGYMTQKFSLWEDLTVQREPRVHGGRSTACRARRRARASPSVVDRVRPGDRCSSSAPAR